MQNLINVLLVISSICPLSGGPIGRSLARLRARILNIASGKIAKKVNIGRYNQFYDLPGIEIGEQSGIRNKCRISGPLKIGKYCMVSDEVIIMTQNHAFDDLRKPIGEQGMQSPRQVLIEDDVWIGARVIILPGVKIGKGSVIGAGSVLRRDIPSNSVVIGNPAIVVRKRGEKSAVKTRKVLGK